MYYENFYLRQSIAQLGGLVKVFGEVGILNNGYKLNKNKKRTAVAVEFLSFTGEV